MRPHRICYLLFLAFLLCACGRSAAPDCLLEIICLDAGQGDSTLLRTPHGDILIDAGTENGQDALCQRLQSLGVRELELAIFTHADEDHIGGGDGVLRSFPTARVWHNGVPEDHESYHRLEAGLYASNASVEIVQGGDFAVFGDVTVTVLAPIGAAVSGNEGSLVLAVHCGAFSMLFPGDAGAETEATLLEYYPSSQLAFTILHAGHHGSNSSGSAEFLSRVSPEAVVISCGAGNSYGHPDGRALARFEAVGAAIYRTDLLGEIHIRTDGQAYTVSDV